MEDIQKIWDMIEHWKKSGNSEVSIIKAINRDYQLGLSESKEVLANYNRYTEI